MNESDLSHIKGSYLISVCVYVCWVGGGGRVSSTIQPTDIKTSSYAAAFENNPKRRPFRLEDAFHEQGKETLKSRNFHAKNVRRPCSKFKTFSKPLVN